LLGQKYLDNNFHRTDQEHQSQFLAEFLTLFIAVTFVPFFLSTFKNDIVAPRKIRTMKFGKFQLSSCLSLDQVSSRRQQVGKGISDMRSLFFWHVKQRRLVVTLPTFLDKLSVPSSSVKQSKETDVLSRN
jgi:hypothetical protein